MIYISSLLFFIFFTTTAWSMDIISDRRIRPLDVKLPTQNYDQLVPQNLCIEAVETSLRTALLVPKNSHILKNTFDCINLYSIPTNYIDSHVLQKCQTIIADKNKQTEPKIIIENPEQSFKDYRDKLETFTKQKFNDSVKKDHDDIFKKMHSLAIHGSKDAQLFLANAYMYGNNDTQISHATAIHYCQQYIESLISSSQIHLPESHDIVGYIFGNKWFKKNRAVATLNRYYLALTHYHSNKPYDTDTSSVLRANIIKLLCDKNSDSLKNTTPDNKNVALFLATDGFIAIPLLEKKLESLRTLSLTDKSASVRKRIATVTHFLGVCAYANKNYAAAYHYFVSSSHGLLTQCLALETRNFLDEKINTDTIKDSIKILKKIFPLLCGTDNQQINKRAPQAKKIIIRTLKLKYRDYTTHLLSTKQYDLVLIFFNLLTQIPETYDLACEVLLDIKHHVAQLPQALCTNIISSLCEQDLIQNITQVLQKKDHAPNLCLQINNLLAFWAKYTKNNPAVSIFLKKEFVKHARCMVTHESATNQPIYLGKNLNQLYAHYAYEVAVTYNSNSQLFDFYLSQAIEYGDMNALVHKISLLHNASKNELLTKEQLYYYKMLSENNFAPSVCQAQVDDDLISHYLHLSDKNNAYKITAYNHLMRAYKRNNYNYLPFLAHFYHYGISNDENEWFIKPDLSTAIRYYSEYIRNIDKIENKQHLPFALLTRGFAHYYNDQIPNAYADFQKRAQYEMNPMVDISLSWIINIIRLEKASLQQEKKAITALCLTYNKNKEYLKKGIFTRSQIPLLTNKSLLTLKKITSRIMQQEKTTDDEILFCSIFGRLFYQSTNDTDNHWIKCIKYAAGKKIFEAQIFSPQIPTPHFSDNEKIDYLQQALITAQNIQSPLVKSIKTKINEMLPKDVIQQADLINYYDSTDNPETLKIYLSHLYDTYPPVVNPCDCDIKPLIDVCDKNKYLQEYAKNFMSNPKKASSPEMYATILLGALYGYSRESKTLAKGACYLQKIFDEYPQYQPNIATILSSLYLLLSLDAKNELLKEAFIKKMLLVKKQLRDQKDLLVAV